MKLESHWVNGPYRRGFRLEVMPCAGIPMWVRIGTFPGTVEGAALALAEYGRVRGCIERDEGIIAGSLGLCRGVALWADPLVSADLQAGLDAATPGLGEAFEALSEGLSTAIEFGRGAGKPMRVPGGRGLLGFALPAHLSPLADAVLKKTTTVRVGKKHGKKRKTRKS